MMLRGEVHEEEFACSAFRTCKRMTAEREARPAVAAGLDLRTSILRARICYWMYVCDLMMITSGFCAQDLVELTKGKNQSLALAIYDCFCLITASTNVLLITTSSQYLRATKSSAQDHVAPDKKTKRRDVMSTKDSKNESVSDFSTRSNTLKDSRAGDTRGILWFNLPPNMKLPSERKFGSGCP